MTVGQEPDSKTFPLVLGDAEDFRRARKCLQRLHFFDGTVSERLGVGNLGEISSTGSPDARPRLLSRGDALDTLIRAFLTGEFVSRAELEEVLFPEEHCAFVNLDLLRRDPGDERSFSPVRLAPVPLPTGEPSEVFLAADRTDHPDGSPFEIFPDFVFSGHNPLTRQFLEMLPSGRVAEVLDLCTGTGIGALAAGAERVAAVDLAARSVHFARFNCRLNDRPDIEVLEGDLYEPVADRLFSRILAHPPYVPSLFRTAIYRDGGATGEEVVRRIVEGVPRHLKPGGTFHLVCIGIDTEEAPFEKRCRGWLGPERDRFDLVFGLSETRSPEVFARSLVTKVAGSSPQDLERWTALFRDLQVTQFVHGTLAGHRFEGSDGPAQIRRVRMSGKADGFYRLFRWFDWLRRPDRNRRLLKLPLRLAPDTRVQLTQRVEQSRLVPSELLLINGGKPFPTQVRVDAWIASLLPLIEGSPSTRRLFARARKDEILPPGFSEEDLAGLAAFLLERGLLESDLE